MLLCAPTPKTLFYTRSDVTAALDCVRLACARADVAICGEQKQRRSLTSAKIAELVEADVAVPVAVRSAGARRLGLRRRRRAF